MKVFISWSGHVSHQVALILRVWLPKVIQSLEPYVSSEDIDKGSRWVADLSKELDDTSFGIFCITKGNINAPWLNFEAGVLSKSVVEQGRVAPLLFGLRPSEIKGPLAVFQSTTCDKTDVQKLVQSLNDTGGVGLAEDFLNTVFDRWWPDLEVELKRIDDAEPETAEVVPSSQDPSQRSDILEEVLELLRRQNRLLNSPEELIPREYLEQALTQHREFPSGHLIFQELENIMLRFNEAVSERNDPMIQQLWPGLRNILQIIIRKS